MALPVFTAGSKPTAAQLVSLQPVFVRKLADQTITSSTAMTNDTELFIPVLANVTYEVWAHILYTAGAAAATNGIKVGWSGPAGATFDWSWYGKIDTDGTNAAASVWVGAFAIGSTVNSGGAGATVLVGRPYGMLITTGTSGNLQFKWAQATSSGTGTVVKAQSFLCARRVE
jgi:hypothetical protein